MKNKSIFLILLFALLMPWAANAQTLFSEGFEGGSMPTGWTTDGPGTWRVGSGDYSSSTGAGMGTYNALITHGSTGNVTKLITPEIDLSSVTSAVLSFMHVQRSWAGDTDNLKVYYRTSSSETWTQLVAYTSAISSWTTEEEIVLPNTTATYQLAFEYTDNYGYGVGLDQVVISVPTSCLKPAGLAATPNGQSATLTWNSDASSFHVAYSTDGTANPDDLTYTTVNTNSYTKDNLAIDTDHYFWVRANCSATEQSAWVGPVSVHIGYCVPAPTSVDNNGISNVTFGMGDYIVNNETPKAFYADYTSQIGAVQAGVEATIAITFKTSYTYNTYVWVDLDNSLTFDADEVVCYGESTSSNPTTLTLNFTIPADQTLGDFRLRIGSADSGLGSDPNTANPCYTGTYGCFQDYTLRVLAAPDCLIPTGLALTASGNTFTATWNGTADTYNIDINGTVTNNVTSPYTFTGEYGTTYTVKVQANCGGETSEWSNPQSVTTDLCAPENMCAINITLTDAFGDGGGQIQVVDVLTNEVLGTFTNANGSSVSYTLNVCDGRAINFVFASTDSWSYENGWVITDINGDVITEHVGCSSSSSCNAPSNGIITTYTVSCTVSSCRKPTDLATTAVFGRSAILNWTENGEATAWVVAYSTDGTEFREVRADAKPFTLEGLEPETDYFVKVRPVCDVDDKWSDMITFTTEVACAAPGNVAVSDIEPNSATVSWTGEADNYNLRYRELTAEDFVTITFAPNDVWQDGTGYQLLLDADATAYGTIIPESGGLTTSGNASAAVYAEFEYKIPVNADGAMNTTNVLIGESVTIQVPAGTFDWCVTNPTPGDRIWIAGEGRSDDYVFEGGNTYLFVVQSNGDGGDEVVVTVTETGSAKDVVWTEINNVTSPYTITVEPEKDYIVEVQANCGDDGTSAWAGTNFSTPSNCQVPTPLDVTDITAFTATLNWTGFQESYEVRYRTPASRELLFFEDFDDQPSTWTLTNATYNRTSSQTTDYFVYLGYESTETAYLITPDLTDIVSVGTVEFKHRSYNGDATFQVGFSSTTNDVDAFTWGDEISAAGVFFTAYDIAMPAGTKYVAVKSTTSESSISVFINDFGIYGNEIPAGEWNTATANTTSCPISGLAAETEYEWQVRGENRSCDDGYTEWCEAVTFTTEVSCPVPTDLVVNSITIESAVASWTSDASSFDIEIDGVVTEDVTSPYTITNLEPGTVYSIRVRANCGSGDYSHWTSAYTFRTPCTAFDLPYEYGFDDVTSENPEIGCWSYGSFNTENSVGFVWRDEDAGDVAFMFSSYNSATDYSQFLISPELNTTNAVKVSFEYKPSNTTELFQVGYSSTSDFSSFTWGDVIEADNTEEYMTYTDTVPAGTKYIALLYVSDYQYYLYIDNFSFEEVITTVTQTIPLVAGWNWCSSDIDITLDDLKAALVDALGGTAITLSQKNASTTYNGSRWRGQLNTLDLTQMFMVSATVDGELVLEGMPVDPAEQTITILGNAANWIAYPLLESMTVTNAFAGFAVNGDNVAGKSGGTTYNGARWRGALTTLEPGQGYIYTSASAEDRPFVFPAAAKSAPKMMLPVNPIVKVEAKTPNTDKTSHKCKSTK